MVDLGCWPGGWLQVASAQVGPKGRVVGIDRAPIDPPLELDNVEALEGDLMDPSSAAIIKQHLGGSADVLLSDAAPKLTGIRDRDRALEEELLAGVEMFAREIPGGTFRDRFKRRLNSTRVSFPWRRSLRL